MMNYMQIAQTASQIAAEHFANKAQTEASVYKVPRDYATQTDLDIETAVTDFLKNVTPDIGVIGEEFSPETGSFELAWVIDPIDGTVNFSRSHPLHGFSIALITPETPLVSVLTFPMLEREYLAELGSGATVNGERISVAKTSTMQEAIVAFGDFAVTADAETLNRERFRILEELVPECLRIRMHGSAVVDMCFLAEGSIDASITMANNAWDMQGGILIAREAGALVTDHLGQWHTMNSSSTIGITPAIQDAMLEIISRSADMNPLCNKC